MKLRLLALVAAVAAALALTAPAASATGRCELKWFDGRPTIVC